MNKYVQSRAYADPGTAARKIVEIANDLEPYMDGRLLVERINGPFLYEHKGSPGSTEPASSARSRRAGS
jgi:hypothetical protein